MTQERVDSYILANQKYLPAERIVYIKEKLLSLDDSKYSLLSSVEFKDPTTMLIVSILGGELGIDRFMLGETGMGILKLLTGGVCGILYIVDWFTVQKKTREFNMQKLSMVI